jgi:hypothetical protein
MPLKYLTKVDMTYTTGNKLEGAIKEYMYSINRLIIPSELANSFKRDVNNKIKSLNKAFPRCKPAEPYWFASGSGSHKDKDWGLSFGSGQIMNFWLYAGRED